MPKKQPCKTYSNIRLVNMGIRSLTQKETAEKAKRDKARDAAKTAYRENPPSEDTIDEHLLAALAQAETSLRDRTRANPEIRAPEAINSLFDAMGHYDRGLSWAELVQQVERRVPGISLGDPHDAIERHLDSTLDKARVQKALDTIKKTSLPAGDLTRRIEVLLEKDRIRVSLGTACTAPETGAKTWVPVFRLTDREVESGKKRRQKQQKPGWTTPKAQEVVNAYLEKRLPEYERLGAACLIGNDNDARKQFDQTFGPRGVARNIGGGLSHTMVQRTLAYQDRIRPILQTPPTEPADWKWPDHKKSPRVDLIAETRNNAAEADRDERT